MRFQAGCFKLFHHFSYASGLQLARLSHRLCAFQTTLCVGCNCQSRKATELLSS